MSLNSQHHVFCHLTFAYLASLRNMALYGISYQGGDMWWPWHHVWCLVQETWNCWLAGEPNHAALICISITSSTTPSRSRWSPFGPNPLPSELRWRLFNGNRSVMTPFPSWNKPHLLCVLERKVNLKISVITFKYFCSFLPAESQGLK